MPDTSVPKPLTADRFCLWLGLAVPGDRIEYHRGFLGCDRHPENLSRPAAAGSANWPIRSATSRRPA